MTLGKYDFYNFTGKKISISNFTNFFVLYLGEYDYEDLNKNPYASMSKVIFVLFQILIPILLFNMLIAMMGNTYATVNEKSEKEFLKMVSMYNHDLMMYYVTT